MRRWAVVAVGMASLWVGAAARGEDLPFDVIQKAYTPYMTPDDPLSFPLKIRAMWLSQDQLWAGGKELFFRWCRTQAAAWLADEAAVVVQPGDQNLSNIGTYLAEGKLGQLGFGIIDFDDSHRLPFQYELLQCIIGLRLTASQGRVAVGDQQLTELIGLFLDKYREAAQSGKPATELLAEQAIVRKLLKRGAGRITYQTELDEYTDGSGHFRRKVYTNEGQLKELLFPAPDRAGPLATGIWEAIGRTPGSQALFRFRSATEVRSAVRDVALRVHVTSAGSQGLVKYFVLLDKPLAGFDHDVVIYAKEQVPSVAERAGMLRPDSRPPAQRCAEDVLLLSRPLPFLFSWCQIGQQQRSYTIRLHEPWSKELDAADVKDLAGLRQVTVIWATVAGAAHHREAAAVAARVNARLAGELLRLSTAYLEQLEKDFLQFRSDRRVIRLRDIAAAAMSADSRERR